MTDTFPADAAAPFSRIMIRVAALVFCGDGVALIRRDRPTSTHYTPIGGNVETGEEVLAALGRELHEELGFDLGKATAPELLWVVDQMVSRPGPAPSPRKLHLIHRVHVTPRVRAGPATVEYDELPGGTREVGHIEWRDYRTTRDLPIFPLFPPIGPALACLPAPHAAITDAGLPAVTDDNYTWIV